MLKLLALLALGQLPLIPGLSLREQATFLLLEPKVQKGLALSGDQIQGVETALNTANGRKEELLKASSASDAALLENDRKFAAEAVVGLTEAQRRSLFLRAVRERGVGALADPEVAKEVGLEGAAFTKVKGAVDNMDARDAKLADDLALAIGAVPSGKDADAKIAALTQANEAKEKARAVERKKEEATLFNSLSQPVRLAWKKLVG